jgi:hypothetical protein
VSGIVVRREQGRTAEHDREKAMAVKPESPTPTPAARHRAAIATLDPKTQLIKSAGAEKPARRTAGK